MTDTIEIEEAITKSIIPVKKPRIHPYFTSQPNNIVSAYIKNFTKEGDVVLDPFIGTGVTCFEAALLNRFSVGVDLNPLATLISSSYFFDVSEVGIEETFLKISEKCAGRINTLYQLSEKEIRRKRVPYWYPKNITLPKDSDVKDISDIFTKRNTIGLSILKNEIGKIENSEERRFFTVVFSRILGRASLTYYKDSKNAGGGNSSIFTHYRYWIPAEPDERNVFGLFKNSYGYVRKRLIEYSKILSSKPLPAILMGNAMELPLGDESVDYIYADPPYGANIKYLDLSTIWYAWLGYDLSETVKQLEIIENGDIEKTKEQYEADLSSVFPEMFRVLNYGKYVSFVFAHKDIGFWDTIIKAGERSGFEYVNTVVQPWDRPSFHKINNPLKVLSGQLIINFRKVRNPRAIAITTVGQSSIDIIKNSAELTIVKNNGASTEMIYNDLIPKLLENGLLGLVRKEISDITPLLSEIFEFESTDNRWYIPKDTKIGSFIPIKERVRFYLIDLLKSSERIGTPPTTDEIILSVIPKLINGDRPTDSYILKELDSIAESDDGVRWILKKEKQQSELGFIEEAPETFIPILQNKTEAALEHNEVIYRLSKLALASGLLANIGKAEQSKTWHGESLSSLSIDKLALNKGVSEFANKKIRQIDCIWLSSSGLPVFGFEIEHSTSINTGIERFIELLKIYPNLAKKCVIVCPSSRERKLNEVLTETHFIGAPMYMENKIVYLFYKDILSIYNYFVDNKPSEAELISRIKGKIRSPILSR